MIWQRCKKCGRKMEKIAARYTNGSTQISHDGVYKCFYCDEYQFGKVKK